MEDLDPEELVVCPYDSAHLIRVKRMQPHIYNCRKNYPTTAMAKCSFNATHLVYQAELRWHMMICPDRHQVHSKIKQEREYSAENRGCVEMPPYRPVSMSGESWEEPDNRKDRWQSWSASADQADSRMQVTVTEEETQGLNARQRRQLYLRKKTEQEEAAKNKAQAPPPPREAGGAAQNTVVGGSRSLALFQQQRRNAQDQLASRDIYQEALKRPTEPNRAMAIGRGYSATGPSFTGPGPLGRGRGSQALASDSTAAPSFPKAIGRGAGAANLALSSMVRGDHANINTIDEGGTINQAGRGITTLAQFLPGRGAGAYPSPGQGVRPNGYGSQDVHLGGLGPQGVWGVGRGAGGIAPITVGAVGRGSGRESAKDGPSPSVGLPLGGMTSQPDTLTPRFQHMTVGGAGGRGRGITTETSLPREAVTTQVESSESEDPERYEDAPHWIGSGYGHVPAPDSSGATCAGGQPFVSGSSTSLGSNPVLVGTWIEEVEREEEGGSAVSMSESVSTDSDFQEPDSSKLMQKLRGDLKKVEKKLRQIMELEAKMDNGHPLDADQEEKLRKKEEYEREASRLRELLDNDGSK